MYYIKRALDAGSYLVRVKVNGNLIPTYQYVAIANTYIQVSDSYTPKITSIYPTSGLPDSFVTIKGDFKVIKAILSIV